MSRLLSITTHPGSKKDKIVKLAEGKFEIWVKAKAERNLANHAVIQLLSEFIQVPTTSIRILTGHRGKHKKIEIK